MNTYQKIKKSATYIAENITDFPTVGIILGSGLGSFTNHISIQKEITFASIPGFPVSSVDGHAGKMVFGKISDIPVLVMQGRVHFYEGYDMDTVTFPIRVMHYLGIRTLLISNAAGGMNPDFIKGDLMVIEDHIHLMPNPLVGKCSPLFGTRFTDISTPYDPNLIMLAESIARKHHISLKSGVYVGVTGPTYETPAEYKLFRLIGGDAVGMSTTPEVIVARYTGIKCFGISVITDLGIPGEIEYLTHAAVTKIASESEPLLAEIFRQMIMEMHK